MVTVLGVEVGDIKYIHKTGQPQLPISRTSNPLPWYTPVLRAGRGNPVYGHGNRNLQGLQWATEFPYLTSDALEAFWKPSMWCPRKVEAVVSNTTNWWRDLA